MNSSAEAPTDAQLESPQRPEPSATNSEPTEVPRSVIWFMAVSVGLIVANVYYIQPLLALIASDFHLSVPQAGALAMICQFGSACGMFFFVPLGDVRERRKLITVLLLGAAVALLFVATARNAIWLALACVALGACSANVHVFVPFAAHLAPPKQSGRVLGIVLSGLLFGILLARTFSGFMGAHFGWRAVYWVGAVIMLALAVCVRFFLPRSEPEVSLTYKELMQSIAQLAREHGALRESAFLGALLFATFTSFWTTLVFLLETPPFHYGSDVAGLFGLVGAAGAAGAPLVGRLADKHGPRVTLGIALLIVFVSYVWLGLFGKTIAGLVVGVILLDLGVQSGHVSNQTRIYALNPKAKSRLNTIYMVVYFTGAATGSLLSAWAWRFAHWPGVCVFALATISLALVVYFRGNRKYASAPSRNAAIESA